jgi:flagellar motor switch protein FliN
MEKQLISAFAAAWNETARQALGCPTTLTLLAVREVADESIAGALAVAATWSSAYFASCEESLSGVVVCLFKGDESEELDQLAAGSVDGAPKPGVRAVVKAALNGTSAQLAVTNPALVTFSEVRYFDLAGDESRLAAIVGECVWVGTFSLTVGDEMESQAMLLYAPAGSLDALPGGTPKQDAGAPDVAEPPASPASPVSPASPAPPVPPAPHAPSAPVVMAVPRSSHKRDESPRNIERLLDVELDVVVRFGVTNVPLRSVVRMGVGTMIELNRAVEEPVEWLVNGRQFARGEVAVVDGYYGVRITEIGEPAERALSLL